MARDERGCDACRLPGRYVVAMFWPLIGGFIAFVLLAIFMGWIMDPARRGDIDKH